MLSMVDRKWWKNQLDKPKVEWALFAAGILLIAAGIVVSPLPGPGGVFFIAPGLALVLRSSMWAKRHYVKVKRWQPRAGRWMDWTLRRSSYRRREAIKKAQRQEERAQETPVRN
jgi:hypothetical protein